MPQLLGLVTQMYDNEGTTDNIYNTESWLADADPQNNLEPPTHVGYFCLDSVYIFIRPYDSTRGITLLIQKRLGKLREI